VRSSITLFKRILSDVAKDEKGAQSTATVSSAPVTQRPLKAFSSVAADSLACISACPLINLRIPPVKTLLQTVATAYEHLYTVLPSPASQGTPAAVVAAAPASSSAVAAPAAKDVALRLAMDWARELSPGLSEPDFVKLTLFLMLFLHARDAGVVPQETRVAISELIQDPKNVETILSTYFSSCPPTYVGERLRGALASLAQGDAGPAWEAASAAGDRLLSITYASSVNLERIYAHSRSRIIMVRVKDVVVVHERLVAFAAKQRQQQQQQASSGVSLVATLGRPVIIDATTRKQDHFW